MVSFIPLKVEGFGPVLQKLQDREDPVGHTVLLVGIVLVLLVLLPLVANTVRQRIRRRKRLLWGFDQLEKIADQNAFDPKERRLVEAMADAVPDLDPETVLSSLDGFDKAARAYVRRARKLPWLKLGDAVDRMAAVREKMGFRYIRADRRPRNTRHLLLGQKLFVLARSTSGFRLLSGDSGTQRPCDLHRAVSGGRRCRPDQASPSSVGFLLVAGWRRVPFQDTSSEGV